MVYIIVGVLTAILGFFLLWRWFKYANPFTPLFELGFLLSIFPFGYSVMFFCMGIFCDNKQTKNTDANECVIENTITENTITEDTSMYILLKIDTIYYGRKCDFKEELNRGD